MVVEELLQIMFMSGASFRHTFHFFSDCRNCWGIPVLLVTFPPSPVLPEQIGLGVEFIPCSIPEVYRLDLSSDVLRLELVGVNDCLSVDRHPATLGRGELLSHIPQKFELILNRLNSLLSICFDVFDLLIIDIDMRMHIEPWVGTLDVVHNGRLNRAKCPENVTLDGEQRKLLITLIQSGQ